MPTSENSTNKPHKNSGRDRGWYKAPNRMVDKWARIIGPQPFLVWHVMKSMCISDSTFTSPQATQQDWAEWCGVGVQVFARALKKLIEVGLVEKIAPGNPAHAMQYEIKDLDEVLLTEGLLKHTQPLSSENRFHDPLFEPDAWQHNIYRKAQTPRIKRVIRDHLNGDQPERSVTGNGTRSVTGNGTIVRQNDSKTGILPKEGSIRVPNGTPQFLNDSFSSLNSEWKIISNTKEQEEISIPLKRTSFMTDRINKNISLTTRNISHQGKIEQLPPQEQMPRSMQVWYNLPLVSKPKTRKVYQRNLSYLQKLSMGQFPTEYKNLKSDWTHRKGQSEITRKHLERPWSDEEVAHLLDTTFRQVLTDIAYWPRNKEKYFKGLSFESFLFNRYSGRSWLLELEYRQPLLDKSICAKQTLEQDAYTDCTREIAEALEISRKTNQDEYAGIARNFAKIMKFFQLLPVEEEHEFDGVFKFANHPKMVAYSLAAFLRQEYGWVKDPGAGLISLGGKPFRQWVGEWNDQEIHLPGRQRVCGIWDLLDEYNQHGVLRSLASVERSMDGTQDKRIEEEEEEDEALHEPTEAETKRRREEVEQHLAPEDIIYAEGEKPEKGAMWSKIKVVLARLKHGIPDPIVDESYAGF